MEGNTKKVRASRSMSFVATVSKTEVDKANEVKEEDFYHGEGDVVRAQILSAHDEDISFSDLTAIVLGSNSCALTITKGLGENLFGLIDSDNSGEMTIAELRDALHREEVTETLKQMKQPLLVKILEKPKPHFCAKAPKDTIKDTFELIAAADGKVNRNAIGEIVLHKDEFSDWLVNMREERINYYYRVLLLQVRAYAGNGMEPGPEPGRYAQFFRRLNFPRGWYSDFVYFIGNHHPLVQLIATDERHPYSTTEKEMTIFTALMTTFVGTAYVVSRNKTGMQRIWFGLIYATMPTMVMQQLSYGLLACPCLVRDESAISETYNFIIKKLEGLGSFGGKILVLIAVFFLIFGSVLFARAGGNTTVGALGNWVLSLVETYILWVLFVFCTLFLPSRRLSSRFAFVGKLTFGLFVVGQWHHEQAKVFSVIRSKIEQAGEANLLLPDEMAVGIPTTVQEDDIERDVEAQQEEEEEEREAPDPKLQGKLSPLNPASGATVAPMEGPL